MSGCSPSAAKERSDAIHLLRSVLTWGGVEEIIGCNVYDRAWAALENLGDPVAAGRLPDHAERAMREPGPVTREEAASMLFSGDYDHLLAGEFAALYPCPDPTPVSAAVSPAEPPEGTITHEEALTALNALRSNVVGTQSAGWSNLCYPLVAILNAAGFEQFDPTDEQLRQHMNCYGGAGGYPGRELREPRAGWCEPVGRLKHLSQAVRRYLADPTDENRGYLAANLRDEQ